MSFEIKGAERKKKVSHDFFFLKRAQNEKVPKEKIKVHIKA